MKTKMMLRRFFLPPPLITLYCLIHYRAKVSARAEVEVSGFLKLGKGVEISSFCKIKSGRGPLEIGRNTHVAAGCFISSHAAGLYIGEDALIGPQVSIIAGNYKYDRLDQPIRLQGHSSKGVHIGNNVWIGAGTAILDGATIGEGVIIAANSVVTGAIPGRTIVQGNPGKVIFKRR